MQLKDTTKQQEFKIVLLNKFQVLDELLGEETISEKWQTIKESFKSTVKEVLGPKKATPQRVDFSWDPQEDCGEKKEKGWNQQQSYMS